MNILAVGTVAIDSIETPFGSAPRVLGGSATYITLTSRYFVDDVRLVAVVGHDFPVEYMETLESSGVDLGGLEVDQQGKTFAWEGRYHYNLNDRDTLATHLNVLENFAPRLPERFKNSRIVCLGNLDPEIQMSVLDQVADPEYVICDTMNFWIEHTPGSLRELLGRVDCLIINDAEARQLADEPNLVCAARHIREMGPATLIIKKGEHGALLFNDHTVFSAPAFPLENIVDPTGAGDTFAGGFAGYLAREGRIDHETLRSAVIYGSAMASFCVEQFGPAALLDLTDDMIESRISAFRDLSTFPQTARFYRTGATLRQSV